MRVMCLMAATCFLASAAALSIRADEPKSQEVNAQEILARVAKTYANCKSYRDSGVVKSVLAVSGKQIDEKPFTTAFVRPDRFRFEYKHNLGGQSFRFTIWRKGNDVQTWWDGKPGVENPASLGLALLGATGVSGGSAHFVPALLLPTEVGGRRVTDMIEAKRTGDAKQGGVDCFRVEGKLADSPVTLWIDKKAHLVRRIDTKMTADVTTSYDPVMNQEIPDNVLKFDPPKDK